MEALVDILKIRKIEHGAIIPTRATEGSAGMDLHAMMGKIMMPGERYLCPTGIALQIPDDHEGQIRPRSGRAVRDGLTVLNAPGTIDSDYRGEIKVVLINLGQSSVSIKPGDRIAQLVIAKCKCLPYMEVEAFDAPTDRGDGGFGSSGD
jgi:dUTP pyrophosphatase